MNDIGIIGSAIALGWLLCGFYAVNYLENRASRERIPTWLFPYLELFSLFLGPVILLLTWLHTSVLTGLSGWWKEALDRHNRVPVTILDARGQEMYTDADSSRDANEFAVRELKKIMHDALRQCASDIFIDPAGAEMAVRFRVDGALREYRVLDPALGENVINVVKVVSGMDIAEKRRPQDGSFSIKSDLGPASLRVATVGAFGGEKVAIRVLGSSAGPLSLEDAGLRDENLKCMRNAVKLPSGMVLICGPTGSGKTTTLYALLKAIDYRMKNVISIEDPIEHIMKNVSQMEVNTKADISFGKLLRNSLRQNPDIICLGEIRDEETAQVAVHAAQTGHLIIATVHSNDNVGTVDRLVNLGVPLRSVAGVLQLIVSQRLVRKLCDCAEPAKPSLELYDYLTRAGLPTDGLRKPKGCKKCGGTGYSGRIALFDIMVMTNRLREVFEDEHATISTIKIEIESEHGSSIIAYEGYKLAAAGVTSVEEVERVTFDMEHTF